ncbi:MAG: methionyl aminopeptidase [Eubacterium sp.]|nr:methionyl aminopeptidase [Eubacterium sp.]
MQGIELEEKIGRNEPCWCGSGRKYKACHMAFDERINSFARQGHIVPPRRILKTAEDIAGIKESSKINRACLDEVEKQIKAGMSTQDIDDIVAEVTRSMGGIPAPLNYEGYPKSVCTSVNDVVCHGIPDKNEILKDGDIINVDCSTILNGYFSDSSRMYMIGEVSEDKKKLVQVTKECIQVGLDHVKPWTFLGDMGNAVHQHALDNGYTVVRQIGGHGIGLEFHEEPFVSFVSEPGTEMLMVPGMCFTIEPMVNMGTDEIWEDSGNGWTIRTDDGLPSAQWEVQLVVTEDGYEVLTW